MKQYGWIIEIEYADLNGDVLEIVICEKGIGPTDLTQPVKTLSVMTIDNIYEVLSASDGVTASHAQSLWWWTVNLVIPSCTSAYHAIRTRLTA